MIVAETGEDRKPLPHYGVSASEMRRYIVERTAGIRASWGRLQETLKRSASALLGEGTGGEILRRARPALGAAAARRLSAALSRENLTVYRAINEVTSIAKTLGISDRVRLETLAGEVVNEFS
jgi:hypothetical protein